MIKIGLVPIGKIDEKIWSCLRAQLPAKLKTENVEVTVQPALPAPDSRQARLTGQSLSTVILENLAKTTAPEPGTYVLAIIDEDLTDPAIEYVLTEVDRGRRLGVISLARLRQEFYKLPPEEEVFMARLMKITLHALGTLFGLDLCPDAKCLMSYCRNTHEIDRKYTVYCLNCWPKIQQHLGQK